MAMMCLPCIWLLVQGLDPVPNGSTRFGATPNLNLNHWSSSAPTPNPRPNLGLVQPNHGNPIKDWLGYLGKSIKAYIYSIANVVGYSRPEGMSDAHAD